MQKLNPQTPTVRTSIALEQEMVDAIEDAISWLECSKSLFIRLAIEAELKRLERKRSK